LIIHVLLAIGLIALILLQQGKGATMGASFGAGASQTVFGSQGSSSFLLKLTGGIGLFFFVTSLSLNYISSHHRSQVKQTSIVDQAAQISQIKQQEKQQDTTMPKIALPSSAT